MPAAVTLDRIETALLQAAELTDIYGDRLKPILLRLEAEYAARANCTSQADRIRQMIAENRATDRATFRATSND